MKLELTKAEVELILSCIKLRSDALSSLYVSLPEAAKKEIESTWKTTSLLTSKLTTAWQTDEFSTKEGRP